MIPEWLYPIVDFFDQFVTYYQAQTTAVQVLLVILVVLAFVAAALVVYGALWVTYQAVKGTIVGTILLVWLAITGVALLFTVFSDEKKAEAMWKEAKADMCWFVTKAYPSKHPHSRQDLAATDPGMVMHRVPTVAREVPASLQSVTAGGHFCTACGAPFSSKMRSLLGMHENCYCEHCGQNFTSKGVMAALARP